MPKKRKDGLRERKVTINGKRISVYGHSVDEIDEKIKKLKEDAEQGIKADKNITLDDLFDLWIDSKEAKKSSICNYKRNYAHVSDYIGNMKIKDINEEVCEKVKNKLRDQKIVRKGAETGKKLSSTGVNSRLNILSSLLQFASDRRMIAYNPMAGIKRLKRAEPKIADREHRALTPEELSTFFSKAKDSEYVSVMRFMAYTGMRCGEATALTWGDIESDKAHVTKTTSIVDGKPVINQTPKTDSSVRYVPLSTEAQKVLADQKKRLMMLYGGSALREEARIFPKNGGGLITSNLINSTIYYFIGKLNQKGNQIDRFSPHAFRHTFATQCVNQGMKPQTLQKILGHKTLAMTMDLYYHTSEDQKQEEMQKIKFAF